MNHPLPLLSRISRLVGLSLTTVLLQAGCAPAADGGSSKPSTGAAINASASDGQLELLTEHDLGDAGLSGELACSFLAGDGLPILYATGMVASKEPAQAVVKVSGKVERMSAPGGFDGITEDSTFTGQQRTIRVRTTGAAAGGGESPPRPANLTSQYGGTRERTYSGQWQCGP